MKWILFGIFVVSALPVLTTAGVLSRCARQILLALVIYTTVFKISVNFDALPNYRGPDRGYEVHVTDLLMVALGIGVVLRRFSKVTWLPYNSWPQFIYFGLACISAAEPTASLHASFTLFKLAKSYLLYWVMTNTFRTDDCLTALWWSSNAILITEFGFAFKQKYINHLYRVNGTFDHSNTIPAYLLLLMPMVLAWAFHGERLANWQRLASVMSVLMGAFAIAATMSRFGLAMMGLVLTLTVGRMLVAQPTRINLVAVGLLSALVAVGVSFALDTYIDRFLNAPKASAESRDEFNVAADRMARDRFFGIGINCFSQVMTDKFRYNGHIRHMAQEETAGVCHHIYRLTMAELGYIGLGSYLLIVGRFFQRIARPAIFRIQTLDQALLFGLTLGAFALHGIGLFEWVFRLTPVLNLYLIECALGVALAERALSRSTSKPPAQPIRAPVPSPLSRKMTRNSVRAT